MTIEGALKDRFDKRSYGPTVSRNLLEVGTMLVLAGFIGAVGYGCYRELRGERPVVKEAISETDSRRHHTVNGQVVSKAYLPGVDTDLNGRTSLDFSGYGVGGGLGLGSGGIGIGIGGVGVKGTGEGHTSLSGSTSEEARVGVSCEQTNFCCPGYVILQDKKYWATLREGDKVVLTFDEFKHTEYYDRNEDRRYNPGEKIERSIQYCDLKSVVKKR